MIMILFLQGCAPAAFVAGACAGGAVIYDHRNTETMLFDQDATYNAQTKIDNDPELGEKAHISVSTFDRIMLLVGQAPTQDLRNKAECLAKAIPHVKMVYNEITVENPTAEMVRANDTWITSKVKTVLFANRNLHSSQIKIVTENGVVYLMGMITRSQAKVATTDASHVTGVCKVVKLFEYIS
jgi:osmotically-inducible protein OsmY